MPSGGANASAKNPGMSLSDIHFFPFTLFNSTFNASISITIWTKLWFTIPFLPIKYNRGKLKRKMFLEHSYFREVDSLVRFMRRTLEMNLTDVSNIKNTA